MKSEFITGDFVRGLELNDRFYGEMVAPALKSRFPDVRYSAALIGWGSDVLGFDDAQSTDHNWGLRFQLFLPRADFKRQSRQIDKYLSENLPDGFLGRPIDFEIRVNADQRGEREHLGHNIDFETTGGFFRRYLGYDPGKRIAAADWLTFPEHKLLAVTSGKIFYDGLGELGKIRRGLAYFPHDVWLYMLASQWSRVFEGQAFVGRCGQTGDETGSVLAAARQIRNLMRLCFLIERKYAPYAKWFGTSFSRLDCSGGLIPLFDETLRAENWRARQDSLARSYRTVIRLYNGLRVTGPMSEEVSENNRPFLVIKDESVVGKLGAAISDGEVKNIPRGLGSVSQFIDSDARLNDVSLTRRLKTLYR